VVDRPASRDLDILAVLGIAGVTPKYCLDELQVSTAMRRAGGIILSEYQGEVEADEVAERVYWVMRTVLLLENPKTDTG
jgi:hypothetical protein